MDSTHISGKQLLFAYCITDGVLDEMTEEQQSSVSLRVCCQKEKMQLVRVCCREKIAISERLLSDNKIANSEYLLSRLDANEDKSIFVRYDPKKR